MSSQPPAAAAAPSEAQPGTGPILANPEAPKYPTYTQRVQVPNYKVSAQTQNYRSQYGYLKYPIVRYFGPLGIGYVAFLCQES